MKLINVFIVLNCISQKKSGSVLNEIGVFWLSVSQFAVLLLNYSFTIL